MEERFMEEEEFFDSCRKSSPDVVDQWLPMNRGYRETAAVGGCILYFVLCILSSFKRSSMEQK